MPAVFLGVLGAATLGKVADPDGVLLLMLEKYAPVWLAGILGAGVISAVMGSDAHQVLALSTMFTKDIYQHYGGREKYGERAAVHFARGFIVIVTVAAYLIALELKEKQGIFEIAVRYAFSGFAAMAPVMMRPNSIRPSHSLFAARECVLDGHDIRLGGEHPATPLAGSG